MRKIVADFYNQWKAELYVNAQGILCCRRKSSEIAYENDAIVFPQLYHAEVLFRAHDDMAHQGMDKVIARIKQRFLWPGLNSAVKKWVTAWRVCQNSKSPPGTKRFPLKNIVSGSFNEIVQIDHQKICQTKTGFTGILVMIDHFTKFVEVAPCREYTAEETCNHLMNYWVSRHGVPTFIQSDNGIQFAAHLTQEFLASAKAIQVFSNTYKPRCNGLVERQNRTLAHMLRVFCSRYMDDWDKFLPQVVGAYNSTRHATTGVSPYMLLTGHERSMPLIYFYPQFKTEKLSPFQYVKRTIERQQELNELVRANTQQAQLRQKRNFDKHCKGPKAYEVGDWVWVFCRIIPAGGTAKLLRGWRGPFRITEVHQGGRYYHLSNGNKAHYEILKPHFSGINEFEVDVEDISKPIKANPELPKVSEQLITDDLSDEEVEVGDLQPFAEEDCNDRPDSAHEDDSNEPDAPFAMHLRDGKKRRSYNSDDSEASAESDSDDDRSFSVPGSLSDGEVEGGESDPDETLVQFTAKPIPGYQELNGDLFQCRKQKRKGHTYALAHCISADAIMVAGIAVDFCNHFRGLRERVESEVQTKGTLIPIYIEEDECWIYNLVTKARHFERPTRRDFHESLVKMQDHAVDNAVAEIHMPRLGAGLDCLNWNLTKQMILEVFRDQPVRLTVYTPFRSNKSRSQAKSSNDRAESSAVSTRSEDATSKVSSRDDDQTIPYGLQERLAGHDAGSEVSQGGASRAQNQLVGSGEKQNLDARTSLVGNAPSSSQIPSLPSSVKVELHGPIQDRLSAHSGERFIEKESPEEFRH